MKKIALITPMLQPYRITFYEKLSKADPNLEWFIYHGVSAVEDGRPNFSGETDFKEQGFRLLSLHLGPFNIRYNRGLFKSLKNFNPDLIVLQSITGNLTNRRVVSWAKRNNKKLVLWTCGWEPGLAKGILLKFKNRLVSQFYRKADFHLTYSTPASKYTETMGVDSSIIRTCFNGIELDEMIQNENSIIERSKIIREKYHLNDFITFLYVGGLIPEKKLDLLLDAFYQLRRKYENIKLLLIGDGPLKDQLLKRLETTNDNHIYYLGRIIKEADDYFAAVDCLVLPGTGGLALNQAMFWRKVCIVSEADGTEDDLIIDGKTGFRFEKDDLNSLMIAMEKRVLLATEAIRPMEDGAREIVLQKSNVNNMSDVFITSIRSLLSAI